MRKITALLGATALSVPALALPLFAGGPVVVEQEPVIVATPSVPQGFDWSGGYVGLQLGYGDVDANLPVFEGYGGLGGVHIGYRWDWGNFIAGAELDYDSTNIDLDEATDSSIDSITRLKLVGGTQVGTGLLYATVGAANAQATVGGLDTSDSGYLYGAGIAYPIWDRWTLGAELLQHNFDELDAGLDVDVTTITARASFRF